MSDSIKSGIGHDIVVSLLTGGWDKPYAYGLATELMSKGIALDLIGNDELDSAEFRGRTDVNFLNLRGDQRLDANLSTKVLRVLRFYTRLIHYAARATPRLFHILWNNKFEFFDRTLLTFYYKCLRKRVVLTVHNVNAGRRDSRDTLLNRLTLRIQYLLADHIFVHSQKMKLELMHEFRVKGARITVIPFGINNSVPNTPLTPAEAKRRLGLSADEKAILFFGNITPYKGVEYLVTAFQQSLTRHKNYRLIIAGQPKFSEGQRYWSAIRETMRDDTQKGRVLFRTDYIPDEETEIYFKAADVLVLPYRHIYQSGVLFLGYSFGLPVLAADVGSLKEEIIQGHTGFVFRPEDPADLARAIETYFASDLYTNLNSRRQQIRDYAIQGHSWDIVGQMTMAVYARLLRTSSTEELANSETATTSVGVKAAHENESGAVPVPAALEPFDPR
jgi:D-inositol-3-phosphate glycosyltransferase